MTTRIINLDRFKESAGFIPQFHRWGNSRKGNLATVTTSADAAQDAKTKARVKLTKQLISAKEYEAVNAFMGELQRWIYGNTVPSFFKEGFQLTGLSGVDPIEQRMRKAQGELAALVNDLVAVFPAKVEEAKLALGDQFEQSDYPGLDELRKLFYIEWNWIAFTVPEGLPEALKQAESDKLQKKFEEAGEQIIDALRTGFGELIGHAVERLTVPDGEKPKKFQDSLIGNIQAFLDTFNQRNLMGDVELAQLVGKAREVLIGVKPQKIRDYADVKEKTRASFVEIQGELNKMIVERASRQFSFDESDETATPAPAPETVAA